MKPVSRDLVIFVPTTMTTTTTTTMTDGHTICFTPCTRAQGNYECSKCKSIKYALAVREYMTRSYPFSGSSITVASFPGPPQLFNIAHRKERRAWYLMSYDQTSHVTRGVR